MRTITNTISAVALWCAAVSLAGAVNVYDVIELSQKGYSDQEIVDIVRTTRSVFKLTAPDIPQLKELGVSEAVIRVMLDSGLAELSRIDAVKGGNSEPQRLNDDADSNAPANGNRRSQTEFDAYGSVARPALFSLQVAPQEAAGDKQHLYVTVLGAPVLILRHEGRFRSTEARGAAIVQNLEEAARMGDGRFRLLRTSNALQVVYHSADLRELPIITLDRQDVYGFDLRSERGITSDILAAYWAALLNDYWAISVQQRRPTRLVSLHRGAALKQFFEFVNATDADRQGDPEARSKQLPAEIRKHLEQFATTVPEDFEAYVGGNRGMS